MACTNCYNGCAQTPPDKCVKYTGIDVPELNIETGDTLFSVEDNIIIKVLEIMVGDGIIPDVPFDALCSQIHEQLPPVGPFTLNDYLIAFAYVMCTTANNLISVEDAIEALEADYTLDCITVDPLSFSTTHNVVQAIIDFVCDLKTQLDALALELSTNYVAIADINDYIAAYILANSPSNLISNKMIPFVAVEYYGTLANFNAGGAGIGIWDKVYLCNGQNGTPDKRGRVPVGVTVVPGGDTLDPEVTPGVGIPNYTPGMTFGNNTTILDVSQMPPHTHVASTLVGDAGHSHPNSTENPANGSGSIYNYDSVGDREHYGLMNTQSAVTGITVSVTNASTGGGAPHTNIQPVLACYYIMYIP